MWSLASASLPLTFYNLETAYRDGISFCIVKAISLMFIALLFNTLLFIGALVLRFLVQKIAVYRMARRAILRHHVSVLNEFTAPTRQSTRVIFAVGLSRPLRVGTTPMHDIYLYTLTWCGTFRSQRDSFLNACGTDLPRTCKDQTCNIHPYDTCILTSF